jgi:hypothetical protein
MRELEREKSMKESISLSSNFLERKQLCLMWICEHPVTHFEPTAPFSRKLWMVTFSPHLRSETFSQNVSFGLVVTFLNA